MSETAAAAAPPSFEQLPSLPPEVAAMGNQRIRRGPSAGVPASEGLPKFLAGPGVEVLQARSAVEQLRAALSQACHTLQVLVPQAEAALGILTAMPKGVELAKAEGMELPQAKKMLEKLQAVQ